MEHYRDEIEKLRLENQRLQHRVAEFEKKEREQIFADTLSKDIIANNPISIHEDFTRQKTNELTLRKSEENLRVTLDSIGDAVISTDLQGKIMQMNPVAQKLTGWNLNDALGKPLTQVFRIINSQTRQSAENPVAKVLQNGSIVGLANHTVLLSANGNEYQIADSAAPIRDDENRVTGVVMVFRDVTEEYANREEIRLKEEALNTFLENSLMAVSMTNEEGMVEIWNQTAETMTGLTKNDIIGKPFYELLFALTSAEKQTEQTKTFYKTLMERGLKTGKTSFSGIKEVTFNHPDGHQVTSRQILIPIKTQKGFRFGTIADDITGLLQAKKQAQDSEEQFRTLAENLPGVVYLCLNDEKYSMIYLNNLVEKITGHPAIDFLENHLSFVDLYHPDDKPDIIKQVDDAIASHKPFHLIYRLQHKNGTWRWMKEWGIGVWQNNQLKYLEGFLTDITEQKQAEQKLRESQERYKRLIDNSPDILYSFSTQKGGSFHSPSVETILGYTPEQLKEDPTLWENSIHPDDQEMVRRAVSNAASGKSINIEYRIKTANGEWVWLHDRSMHLFDNDGELLIEGLAKDITHQKLAEEKLRQSEQNNKKLQGLFRNMADIIPDMLWAKDLNKNYIFVNNSICQNLLNAIDTNEPIGKGDMFFANRERTSHSDDPNWHTFGEICRDSDSIALESGETGRFDEYGNVKGKFLYLDVIKTPLRNENGEIVGVVGAARDITENKQAELKLIEAKEKAEQSDRLKTAFINNITHEIRTPLNGILGFGQMMAEIDLTIKERMEYLKILQSSSNRLLQTVTDFMDISMLTSGNMEMNKTKIQLNTFLDELFNRTKSICSKKDITVTLDIPENSDDMFITSDRELLRKALNHLLGNSEKFTQHGKITTGYLIDDGKPTFFVKDTGVGIPTDKINIMFDVFMQGDTSISRGYEGSGLGLSIVKGIVALLNGKIWAESEPGTGTTFFISLPNQVTQIKKTSPQPPTHRNSESGKPLILVAEDDESNSFYIKVVLEKAGYETICVKNGADAVKICSENPSVNLALMDIKMPEMNGIEATKAIRKFMPALPVVALTAYAQSSDEYRIMEAGCTSFLPKPVKRDELLNMLSMLLKGS